MNALLARQKRAQPLPTPFVSVICPTYNRREFLPYLLYIWQYQDYPADRRELIILDDSPTSNADLIEMMSDPSQPNVRYIHSPERLTLGNKRNRLNALATGEYIICFDDDDYYAPDKISHQVAQMQIHRALFSGSDQIYIWYSHLDKIYLTHSFGPRHALNGTFGYHRNLLKNHRYDDEAMKAEEVGFLNNFTTPVQQIDPKRTILCISHSSNTYDKDFILDSSTPVDLTLEDFVSDPNLLAHYRRLSTAPLATRVNWSAFEKIAVLYDPQQEDQLPACREALLALGAEAGQLWPVAKAQAETAEAAERATHTRVISHAKQQGWKNVVLLDAELRFVRKENAIHNVNKLLNGLDQVDWQMLLLGGRYENFTPTQSLPGVARIFNAGCACAYAVNASYYDALLDAYRQATEQQVSLDRCWAALMSRNALWLGFSPSFAFLQHYPDPKSGEPVDCTHWFFRKHR
ncbi:glycosyltransferase family 2 protein [Enterobacter asburiae]|nr:glycosyltransferase family 2 protein [Enterobacter asburiae]